MKFSRDFVSGGGGFSDYGSHVPAPYLRKSFVLKAMKSAELTICGLGFYELFVNGSRITRGMLSPYDCCPDDYLYYDNYDLMPYLREGENVIGVQLGNGMINPFNASFWNFHKASFRGAPRMALTFEGVTADGMPITFDASDGFKWKDSPIRCDDMRAGEIYDARYELPGWDMPGYDDSDWLDALPCDTPLGECRIADIDPIVVTKELAPISVKPAILAARPRIRDWQEAIELPEEDALTEGYLYDFGVNAAGIVRLHIKNARPGQRLILQFGELTDKDGNLDLRGMYFYPHRYNCRDVYVCRGGDEEVWQASFTYHGFRYCLVMGLDEEQAVPDLLTYLVTNTDLRRLSEFRCSNDIANRIWDAAMVSDLANFHHVPTDCPHREKHGWTGDMAVSAEQMVMCFSVERNLAEWMRCITKSMNSRGAIQAIIPGCHVYYRTGPAWDSVIVQVPYQIWKYRGDTKILSDNADYIYRYLQFLPTLCREDGLIDCGYGDWCHAGMRSHDSCKAPIVFTSTVYAMDICHKAAEIFGILKMDEQREYALSLHKKFFDAARRDLIDYSTMTAEGSCQCSQAMAIYYDLFTPDEKPAAFEQLLSLIDESDGRMDCGILGMRVLLHVLSEYGRSDIAFRMITRTDHPSFGYIIEHGATSLWESFREVDWPPDSHNHHFFGDVVSWMMQNLAGIKFNPNCNNINEVRFAPKFTDELEYACGSHLSPNGLIKASWKRDGDDIVYSVTIPEGMNAELVLEQGFMTADGSARIPLEGSCELSIKRI